MADGLTVQYSLNDEGTYAVSAVENGAESELSNSVTYTRSAGSTITDLTGYTWVGNDSISVGTLTDTAPPYYDASLFLYNVNFAALDGVERVGIGVGTSNGRVWNILGYYDIVTMSAVYMGGWYDNVYKTLEFTGGTDATNSTLIAWLEANGTLTAPIQANTYNLTHTLTNLTKGNITLQITPDTSYTYPTSLTISNGTIVSYDNTTGVAVISGDDTTVVSGECVEQASGYTVTLNNPYNGSASIYDGQDDTGIFLGTIQATSTMDFNITSGYIYTGSPVYGFSTVVHGSPTNPFAISSDITLYLAVGGN